MIVFPSSLVIASQDCCRMEVYNLKTYESTLSKSGLSVKFNKSICNVLFIIITLSDYILVSSKLLTVYGVALISFIPLTWYVIMVPQSVFWLARKFCTVAEWYIHKWVHFLI